MKGADAIAWAEKAMSHLAEAREELTVLDAAAGDGDLGVTVGSGAQEVAAALRELAPDAEPYEVWRAAGAAFARGNPSSYAALMGAGLLAASRRSREAADFSAESVCDAVQAGLEKIAERGRSQVGMRTVLDAITPALQALRESTDASPPQALAQAVEAAREGAESTREMAAARGRALWVGDRAHGTPDGGAVAFVRLLEAFLATMEGTSEV